MSNFKIPCIPRTVPKTIRFPITMVEEIEKVIAGKECTFTAFVLEATTVALKNIKK